MKKLKIFTLLSLISLTFTGVGCTDNKASDTEIDKTTIKEITAKIDYSKATEDILLKYSEEGMSLIKKLYPDRVVMDIALKNLGRTISNVSYKTIDNKEIKINDFKNKKVIFEVMQTTCNICKETSKILNNKEKVLDKDIEVITIFPKDNINDIKEFYKELKLDLPKNLVSLENNKNLNIIEEFDLKATPTLIFLENNTVSHISMGGFDKETLKENAKLAFSENKIYDNLRVDTVEVNKDNIVIASSNPVYKHKNIEEIKKSVSKIEDKLENETEKKNSDNDEIATK